MRWNQRGQAITEYILLLAIVAGFLIIFTRAMNQLDLDQKFNSLISEEFRRSYQYGNPTAKGFDDSSGPENHARFAVGDNNFRIFLNPRRR